MTDRATVRRLRWGLALALALAGGAPGARAEEPAPKGVPAAGAFEQRFATIDRALVVALTDLGTWCEKRSLLRERARLGEVVLRYDPEHRPARAWAGYTKNASGRWARPASYREPANITNTRNLPEFEIRRNDVLIAHRDAVLAILDDRAGKPPLAVRERALAALLLVFPEDGKVRLENDEVRVGAAWRLRESEAARKRRPDLAWALEKEIQALPAAERAEPTPLELKMGASVGRGAESVVAVTMPGVRAAGTLPRADLEEGARIAALAVAMDPKLTGMPALDGPHGSHEMFAFADREWAAAIDADEGFSSALKAVLKRTVAQWGRNTAWIRGPVDDQAWARAAFIERFAGTVFALRRRAYDETAPGLAYGMDVYLTWRTTGTRHHWSRLAIRGTSAKDGESAKRPVEGEDVLAAAHALLVSPGDDRPSLRLAAGKTPDALTPDEQVLTYAVAAYVIEGPASIRKAFFAPATWWEPGHDEARRRPLDEAMVLAFGRTMEGLEARLVRWIEDLR
jgi:hypothetical protein